MGLPEDTRTNPHVMLTFHDLVEGGKRKLIRARILTNKKARKYRENLL